MNCIKTYKEVIDIDEKIKNLYLKKYKIEAKYKDKVIKDIFFFNKQGLSLREIGEKVGLSYEMVRIYLKGKFK